MLTDQDMRFETRDGQRHHELLRMPKGQDHSLSLCEDAGHMFSAFGPPAHCAAQQLNDVIPDWRHHRDFERIRQSLRHGLFRPRTGWGTVRHGIAHLFTLCPPACAR